MDIKVISSFNQDGYNLYGREFIKSFVKNWPKEVDLHLFVGDDITHDTIKEILDISNKIQIDPLSFHQLSDFIRRSTRVWITQAGRKCDARGRIYTNDEVKYSIKYDAVKFAYKTFAIINGTKTTDYDVVLWLDADTITHSQITMDTLKSWLDLDVYTRYLGREQNPKPQYPECGFVQYNVKHPIHKEFMSTWLSYYVNDRVYELDEWHDSWVYDHIRRDLNVPSRSWTEHMPNATTHPFVQVFGKWMDHKKGPRKHSRTQTHELIEAPKNDYWKN